MPRRINPELVDLRGTVHTLQTALDRAHQRVRDLESAAATMAERYAQAVERADAIELADAERRQFMERVAAQAAHPAR
jgi:hypothetical protein